MSSAPEETAKLIRMLCCGQWEEVRSSPDSEEKEEDIQVESDDKLKVLTPSVNTEAFLEVFVEHEDELLEFIKALIQHDPQTGENIILLAALLPYVKRF